MDIRRIPLRFAAGARWAIVREPTGADELALDSLSTFAAVGLIDRLLLDQGEGCLPRGQAQNLAAPDRDQVLAALHGLCFGSEIASTTTCPACARPFDFNFSLSDLAAHVQQQAVPDPSLRLPTGADEIAVATLPPGLAKTALARRCLGDAADEIQIAAFAERLATAAPVISLNLQTACPECAATSQAAFDIQGYFLGRLRGSRAALVREIHKLAAAYHWAAGEILGLPRNLRRALVVQIDAERAPRRPGARLNA